MENQIMGFLLCFFLAVSHAQDAFLQSRDGSRLYTTPDYGSGMRSCRYNCGYYAGNCSCTSDCRYNGNCCPDYNVFCNAGTTAWPHYEITSNSRCGGVLTSTSGSISSPGYPGNYFNYEYCTWQIRVPYGQRIILAFTDLQLELGCCTCDTVTVFDGPSLNNPRLGFFCQKNATGRPLFSSSNYMTILFRSDLSVTNKGFHAVYNTGRESCRSNCGYSHRNCSCYSSCQRNGNCCPDFCNYCSYTNYEYCYSSSESTTTPTEITTPYGSCRYNCGYHIGTCSCNSNCIFYGNCCPDYHDYCGTTTAVYPTTASSCGGYLSNSGSIYSPRFPNYYPDNSYCVWHLSVPFGQRVILKFHEITLENCCSCDYIAVYDGYSTSSPLLGNVCYNSEMRNFHSSSSYMTVVFRSDSSVVAKGFYATFTSSLPEGSGRVDCSSDNMNIVISSSFLNSMGYSGYDLYLNDQRCRPQVSSYQVVFNFPLNTCGTLREFSNRSVVYSNDVRAYYSTAGEITRQSNFQLHVGCYMDQDATAQIMYQAREDINSTIIGTGHFNATMTFYTSPSFTTPVYNYPYIVTLNQYLYVQVELRRNDNSLVLSVDTCVASPSPHDFSTRSYDLVRNGCVIDRTYSSLTNGNRNVAQFQFRAFKFLRSHPMVYLQCKVIVCKAHESNSLCSQPCRSRKTRSLKSTYEDATLVLGPIQLKGTEKNKEKSPEKDVAEAKD